MRLVAPVLVLAACSSPARPPAAEPTNTPEAPAIDDPAIARWRSLALTGASYQEVLAGLDVDDATRAAMARALLLGGDLVCEDVDEQDQCGDIVQTMNPVSPTATFDDPCLRRLLALWAVDQLTPEDGAALEPALLEMVALAEPEEELQDAAWRLVPDDADELRLRLMTVTSFDRAYAQVDHLVDPAALEHAATVLHLGSAVDRLVGDDPELHHAPLAALTDELLGIDARSQLFDALAGAKDQATLDALATVADTSDDCQLAWYAAQDLAGRGDRSHLPARPKGADLAAHLRALCVLASTDGDLDDLATRLRAWIGPRGLDDIDAYDDPYWESDPNHPELDETFDRDGDVTTERHRYMTITTTHYAAADVDLEALTRSFHDQGYVSGWSCGATSCTTALLEIGFTAAGKSLVVSTVRRESYGGDDC